MQQFLWNGAQRFHRSDPCPADAYEQWLGFISRNLYTLELKKKMQDAERFRTRGVTRTVAGFTIGRFTTSRGQCPLVRSAAAIAADSRDDYVLYLPLQGEIDISQFDRHQFITSGFYTFTSAAEPAVYDGRESGGRTDTVCLLVPRDFVDKRVVSGEHICVRPCAPGSGLGSLVLETVSAFEKSAWRITDEEFAQSARLIADLVLLALRGATDAASGERSVRAANLARVKHIIRRHCTNPDLTPVEVARQARLSLSYVHKLFCDDGCTMWQYVQSERLQRARALLEASSPRSMSVTDAALQCGFSNLSHFSLSFKRAFGLSPKEVLRNR